jgi:hypothetical protein
LTFAFEDFAACLGEDFAAFAMGFILAEFVVGSRHRRPRSGTFGLMWAIEQQDGMVPAPARVPVHGPSPAGATVHSPARQCRESATLERSESGFSRTTHRAVAPHLFSKLMIDPWEGVPPPKVYQAVNRPLAQLEPATQLSRSLPTPAARRLAATQLCPMLPTTIPDWYPAFSLHACT